MELPDVGDLYGMLDAYNRSHRKYLLGSRDDPGTVFLTYRGTRGAAAEFGGDTFYVNWVSNVRRFGIFNPYTGKGAIKGLLPHGPHAVRSIIAVHLVKKTGSYLHASYALCVAEHTVRKLYGSFIPSRKLEFAAEILNEVWS